MQISSLEIRTSSPSTTSFTVSTATHRPTLLAKALRVCWLAARVPVQVVCLAVLYQLLFVRSADAGATRLLGGWALQTHVQRFFLFMQQLDWLPRCCVIASQALIVWLLTRRDYIEESLLVIQGLGVQLSTSSPSFLGRASTRFIPTSEIQDIFIHEAFKGFEVKFYLSVIVRSETEVVIVFPQLLPRRHILEPVWRGTREVLFSKG